MKRSDEWHRKQKLRICEETTRQKRSKSLTGRPISDLTRLKMHLAKKGKPLSAAHRLAIKIALEKYWDRVRKMNDGPDEQ